MTRRVLRQLLVLVPLASSGGGAKMCNSRMFQGQQLKDHRMKLETANAFLV